MNNRLVKAIIDTGKTDTIEFQILPGHHLQEQDVITYDKMTGAQYRIENIYNDWITCTILGKGFNVYNLQLKYFQPMTRLYVISRSVGEFPDISKGDSISGKVEFL
jgi:hypothetical protein